MYDDVRAAVRNYPEDNLQRAVVDFLDVALPPDALVFAVPNGGKRHAKEAARMKRLGVKAGIPDLCIIWRGRALFVELKAQRGTISIEQREMHRKIEYCGCPVWVCRTLDAVVGQLANENMPLRALVAA
jgi:hypothetical protein